MKRLALCLFCLCAVSPSVSAHVLDQYLQVAQIALAPDGVRIELRLIPGVEVAERICTLIDADHDGQVSKSEEQAYARRVWQDSEFSLNDVKVPLALRDWQFPPMSEMREGMGTIRLILTATATLGAANQQLYFRNNHLPELGVYLVNALVPATKEIQLGQQLRDPLQREMRLRFHVTSPDTQASLRWQGLFMFGVCLVLLWPQWKSLRRFWHRGEANQLEVSETGK